MAGEIGVDLLHAGGVGGIDEHAVHVVEKAIAGRAFDRPVFGQGFVGAEDLLDDEVERIVPHATHRVLQPAEIRGRIEQAIGMIQPQSRDPVLRDEPQDQPVGGVEDTGILHPEAAQLVDVEEAPIVDLVKRRPPVRKAVRLHFEQRMQPVEARRRAGRAVDVPDGRRDPPRQSWRSIGQPRKPFPCDFLLTAAVGSALRITIGGRWKVFESGENAEVLTNVGFVFRERWNVRDGTSQQLR